MSGDIGTLLRDLPGDRRVDEPLARHTYYKVGGPADTWFRPADTAALSAALERCRAAGVPLLLLGHGANVLVADAGFRGVVLNLRDCCGELVAADAALRCGAGASLARAVRAAEDAGLAGLADLAGIPGTLGGALRMNAGAFGTEIGDHVRWVEGLDSAGTTVRLTAAEVGFGYRRAPGLGGLVLLGCELALTPGDGAALTARRREILERRESKQPLDRPSCGSVFKRPTDDYAGRLIEAAGLKGLRRGDAVVSEKHANFILNEGAARADDIRWLITEVRRQVRERFGVALETEVIPVGFAWDW